MVIVVLACSVVDGHCCIGLFCSRWSLMSWLVLSTSVITDLACPVVNGHCCIHLFCCILSLLFPFVLL